MKRPFEYAKELSDENRQPCRNNIRFENKFISVSIIEGGCVRIKGDDGHVTELTDFHMKTVSEWFLNGVEPIEEDEYWTNHHPR